ncbi:MAG: hypothetical protein ACO1SX_11935 [Actinomycetota bacterium]
MSRKGNALLGVVWIAVLLGRFLWMLLLVGVCLYALSGLAPVSFRADEKLGLVGCVLFFGWFAYRRGRALLAARSQVACELRRSGASARS